MSVAGVVLAIAAMVLLGHTARAAELDPRFHVEPREFDPRKTDLVNAAWLPGLGCPTGAGTATVGAAGAVVAGPPYTDAACVTGDDKDKQNEGLLLAKTGPTANVAAAIAELRKIEPGTVITELGYDIRKPVASVDPRGSHCGAGAPRFNVVTDVGTFFVGCNSPPATTQTPGAGWVRLRWGGEGGPLLAYGPSGSLGPIMGAVERVLIVFDEGQDAGPDNTGLAVLDNIDVNGTLVGRGPTDPD